MGSLKKKKAPDELGSFKRRLARLLREFEKTKPSVEEAAKALGVSRHGSYNYRDGNASSNVPTLAKLHSIAKATKVSVDSLLFDKSSAPLRYRGQSRDVAELSRDLQVELRRRIHACAGVSERFIDEYFQHHSVENVLEEVVDVLCDRVVSDARAVRGAHARRLDEIRNALSTPAQLRARLDAVLSPTPELTEERARDAELLERADPDERDDRPPLEIGERVRISSRAADSGRNVARSRK